MTSLALAASDWISAAGALASASAAGVAVYVGVVQPRRRTPQLSLEPAEAGRELVIAGGRRPDGQLEDTAWVRLSVAAAAGKHAAEDVEVRIIEARELRPREGYPPDTGDPPGIAGMSLPVSAATGEAARVHIPPGASRMFDVAKVCRWHTPGGTAKLEVETAFKAFDTRNQIAWGLTELTLAVTARNTAARSYRIQIAYDGSWGSASASIWEHLTVTRPVAA